MEFSKIIKKVMLFSLTFTFCSVILSNQAFALTYNGHEYIKMLEFKSIYDFGYWPGPDKYFTFRVDDNKVKPILVGAVTYRDPSLKGVNFDEVFAMGKTEFDYGPIISGNVALYDNKDKTLLSGDILPGGELTSIIKPGFAGQLSVLGEYITTGGSLASLFGSSFFVDIQFDRVWQAKYKDLKTNFGTWTFYKGVSSIPPPPTTNIPEPASLALLASGLLGLKCARSKQKKEKIN